MLEAYKALMEQSPPTAEGLHEAADIARRLKRPKDEEAAWRRLKSEFPAHALTRRLALELASTAFKQKNWKDATAFGATAVQSEEAAVRAEAWLLVGEAELKLKRFPQAAKAFEAVGAVDDVEAGTRYRALAGLGLVREEQKEWRAALTAYEAVAGRTPDSSLREWARERAAAMKSQLGKSGPAPPATPNRSEPAKPAGKPTGKKS
jgi:tetratricopeptide (TPR) repeat protein